MQTTLHDDVHAIITRHSFVGVKYLYKVCMQSPPNAALLRVSTFIKCASVATFICLNDGVSNHFLKTFCKWPIRSMHAVNATHRSILHGLGACRCDIHKLMTKHVSGSSKCSDAAAANQLACHKPHGSLVFGTILLHIDGAFG